MELLRNGDRRVEALAEYLRLLGKGPVSRETHGGFREILETATPVETNAALHAVLSEAEEMREWEQPVARFLRSVSASLDRLPLPEYPGGHLLAELSDENRSIAALLDSFSDAVKRSANAPVAPCKPGLAALEALEAHYVRLQNELFPLFEEAFADHACVKLMWTLEDKVLALRNSLQSLPESATFAPGSGATKALGAFFLIARSLLWREERVLFPVAWRVVSPDRFAAVSPVKAGNRGRRSRGGTNGPAFECETGSLAAGELAAIFRVLPVDVSFIGADDRVKFYSDPPHRVFPRSPAVVGRLVQNCHPPKSVATVERIIRSFREGTRDREEFWLAMGDRFIYIEYFAVRSETGVYLGTLEVSRDATDLRALEGEKRLL